MYQKPKYSSTVVENAQGVTFRCDAFLLMIYDLQVGRELGRKFEITSSNPEKLVSTTRKCSPSEVAYSTGILEAEGF